MISVCNRTFLRSFKVCKVAWVSVPKSGSGQSRRLSDVGMSASPPTPDVWLRRSKPTLRAKSEHLRGSANRWVWEQATATGSQRGALSSFTPRQNSLAGAFIATATAAIYARVCRVTLVTRLIAERVIASAERTRRVPCGNYCSLVRSHSPPRCCIARSRVADRGLLAASAIRAFNPPDGAP